MESEESMHKSNGDHGSGDFGSLDEAVRQAQNLIDSLLSDEDVDEQNRGGGHRREDRSVDLSTMLLDSSVDSSQLYRRSNHDESFGSDAARSRPSPSTHGAKPVGPLSPAALAISGSSAAVAQIEQMQKLQQQRIDEITAASMRAVQAKDARIKELTEELGDAKARNVPLVQLVCSLEEDKERLQGEVGALAREIKASRTSGVAVSNGIVGKQMQAMLDAVKLAAEDRIADVKRERDMWRSRCQDSLQGDETAAQMQPLLEALESESNRLAAAREQVAALTSQTSREVAELQTRVEVIMLAAARRQAEQESQLTRQRAEEEQLRAEHARVFRAEAEKEERLAQLMAAQQTMKSEMSSSKRLCEAISGQNDALCNALREMEVQLALVRTDCDLAMKEREAALRKAEELERQVRRLERMMWGDKKGAHGTYVSQKPAEGDSRHLNSSVRSRRDLDRKDLDSSARSRKSSDSSAMSKRGGK